MDDGKSQQIERLIEEITDKVVSVMEAKRRGEARPVHSGLIEPGLLFESSGPPLAAPSSPRNGGTPAGSAWGANPLSRSRPRSLLVLLPAASSKLSMFASLLPPLAERGWAARFLGSRELSSEPAMMAGMPAPPSFEPLSAAMVSPLLASIRPPDAILVGSLCFSFASRLIRLDDDDPFVRLILSAKLMGLSVMVLRDDLEAAAGVSGEIPRRASELLREIDRLGLEVLPADGLETRLERAASGGSIAARGAGGLITEDDVEKLHDSGERRLVLSPRTIITPLARSRAAELGLDLIEKKAD